MKTITAYRCEHCAPGHGRPYASASSCKAHEARCHDNPASHSCATCQFKTQRDVGAPATFQKEYPGATTLEYFCQAKKPGKCLTTLCPSWKLRVDEVPE